MASVEFTAQLMGYDRSSFEGVQTAYTEVVAAAVTSAEQPVGASQVQCPSD